MYKQIMMVALGYIIATLLMFCGFIVLAYQRNALGKAVFVISVVIGFSTMITFLWFFNNRRCPVCDKRLYQWYELFKIQRESGPCGDCRNKKIVNNTNESD